jgi:hypothetical protein
MRPQQRVTRPRIQRFRIGLPLFVADRDDVVGATDIKPKWMWFSD